MADTVATAPAPQPKAAPTGEEPQLDFGPIADHEVIQEVTYAHLEPDEEMPATDAVATDEQPVEEATESTEEAPAVEVPARFKEFRKPTGELDEEALEAAHVKATEEAQRTHGTLNQIDQFVSNNAALKREWLKALKASGQNITPEQEAFITVNEKPTEPEKPQPTEVQMKAHYAKLVQDAKLSGDWSETLAFRDYMDELRHEKTAKTLETERARLAAEDQKRRDESARAAAQAKANKETVEAAKAFPRLLVKSDKAPSGYMISDPAVAKAFDEVNREMVNSPVTMKTILELALHRVGKLGGAKPVPKPVPTARTVPVPVASARSAPVVKPKLEAHEVVQPFSIVGYED